MTEHVCPFVGHIWSNLLETAKLEFTIHVWPLDWTYLGNWTYLAPQPGYVRSSGYRVYKGVPYPLEP
jgi:hypothetical protein